ncbi:MAG: WD40 repeat domain-containing protein [Promethearchaeota archaeon]
MKKNKIIILLFSQMLLITMIFLSVSMSITNQGLVSNNLALTFTHKNTELISSANPNLLGKWPTTQYPVTVDISDDGRYFVSGEVAYCNVTFYDRNGPTWFIDRGDINSVAISADGQYIVSGDGDNNVTLFNRTHQELDNYDLTTNVVTVAISENGSYFVAGDSIGNITLFNKSNPNFNNINIMWNYSLANEVYSVDISKDGQYIVAGDDAGNVTLFKKDRTIQWQHYTGSSSVNSVEISANGSYIVSGDQNGNVTLFDTDGFLWNYTVSNYINSVAISQDGQYIVAGDTDGFVTFLMQNGTKIWDYDTGSNDIYDVAISSDGQFAVAGDFNSNITMFDRDGFTWNYETGNNVEAVAISANGQYIIAGSDDQNVYLLYNDIIPKSNNPGPINTLTTATSNISWVLQDSVGPGKYRVWANDTNGNYYVWRDWANWDNNTNLEVEINRSVIGLFNYTIEYNNSRGYFGIPNMVIINIMSPSGDQDLIPLILVLGMQQAGDQLIIVVLIIGVGAAAAVVIFIVVVKQKK